MSNQILIPVPIPMTREHAHMFAHQELGEGAVVGVNHQYPDAPFFVGHKKLGDWTKVGFGKSWEEAFGDIREVQFQRGNGTFVFKDDDLKGEKKK